MWTTTSLALVSGVALLLAGCNHSRLETHRTAARDEAPRFDASPQRPRNPSAAGVADDRPRGRGGDSLGTAPAGSVAESLARAHEAAQAGRLEEAQAAYEAVLQRQPGHPTARHGLAVIADRRGDFPRAEEHYLTALQSRPDDADLLNDLAYSYLLQRRFADSERYLRRALEIDPEHALAATNLGQVYAMQGDEERALAMFRRVGSESEARAQLARFTVAGHETPAEPSQLEIAAGPTRATPVEEIDWQKMTPEQIRTMMDRERAMSIAARQQRLEDAAPEESRGDWPPAADFSAVDPRLPVDGAGFEGDPAPGFDRGGLDSPAQPPVVRSNPAAPTRSTDAFGSPWPDSDSPRIAAGATDPPPTGRSRADELGAPPLWPVESRDPNRDAAEGITTAGGEPGRERDGGIVPASGTAVQPPNVPEWPREASLEPRSLSPAMTTAVPGESQTTAGEDPRPRSPSRAARRRAAAMGMNAGPGVMLPLHTANRTATGEASRGLGARSSSAADASRAPWDRAENYQQELQRLDEVRAQLERQLAAERANGSGGAAPHPGFPEEFRPVTRTAEEWPGATSR